MTYINDYTDELQLPFRFSLSQAMAARWDAMPEQVRQKYFEDFAKDVESHYEKTSCFDDKKPTSDVVLPGKFVLASILAKRCNGTIPGVSKAFSHYVTVRLRRHRPVRGEVELAKEWAGLIGLQHRLEVPCSAGRIDILFEETPLIVEAKLAGDWKHAIGQVLCYQYVLGKRYKCGLLLLCDEYDKRDYLAELCANSLNVKTYWYSGNGELCPEAKKLKASRRQR